MKLIGFVELGILKTYEIEHKTIHHMRSNSLEDQSMNESHEIVKNRDDSPAAIEF